MNSETFLAESESWLRPMAYRLAWYAPWVLDLDDLLQDGRLGIHRAMCFLDTSRSDKEILYYLKLYAFAEMVEDIRRIGGRRNKFNRLSLLADGDAWVALADRRGSSGSNPEHALMIKEGVLCLTVAERRLFFLFLQYGNMEQATSMAGYSPTCGRASQVVKKVREACDPATPAP